ncbi:MAG: electron transporter RnfD [Schaedlerella sp.]|uniref:GDSL-type esterase/lipase family protein n=1 Tax=Schaedlerella sp. TaxID=2676057 RepID=UPI00262C6C21|nr:GDSL-type esterase/lipase family protein [uncultured Schaedlerella sp.]
MRIKSDHEKLSYCGRIDWSNPEEPVFVFPCTSVGMRFTGNSLKIYVKNKSAYWDNALGCILDGAQTALSLPADGSAVLELEVRQKEKQEHELLLFKRQDACHQLCFLGFELEDGARLLDPPEKPERKMEVYGDSVSAGEVSEAVDYVGKEDPEHNGEYSNSWYSYAWMTARRLNAQIHDIAQGGMALLDGTGWFHAPDHIGMETAWDKIYYHPELSGMLEWDFSQYTPQVVIVALGQNDSHPEDYMKEDYDGEEARTWRQHYEAFLRKLREIYPDARIICCTTLLNHDPAWDRAIGQAVEQLGDEKVTQYLFRRNGRGTPGHLRIPEAEEMAEELAAYIQETEGWSSIWEG